MKTMDNKNTNPLMLRQDAASLRSTQLGENKILNLHFFYIELQHFPLLLLFLF